MAIGEIPEIKTPAPEAPEPHESQDDSGGSGPVGDSEAQFPEPPGRDEAEGAGRDTGAGDSGGEAAAPDASEAPLDFGDHGPAGEQEFSMPDFDFQKTEGSPEDLNDMARNRGKVESSVEAQNPDPDDNAPASVALESEDHNLPPRPEIDLSLGDHEAPDEPAKTPYLPWAYPLPTDQGDDPPAPQFEAPEPAEVQLHPFDKPQDQEPLNASLPGPPQDQEPVIPPQYDAPPPAPVEIGQNEDLFARTGWPVSPPRTVSTHWYM